MAISGDGSVVAYSKLTSRRAKPGLDGFMDVFVCDRASNRVFTLSRGRRGHASNPSVTHDGRTIVYLEHDDALSPDGETVPQIFVATPHGEWWTPERAVRSGSCKAHQPTLTGDGASAFFAADVPTGPHDGRLALARVQLESRTEELVEFGVMVDVAPRASGAAASSDGRFLAVTCSAAVECAPRRDSFGRRGAATQIVWLDRSSNLQVLVSHDALSECAGNDCYGPSIAGDGSIVAFVSKARLLAEPDSRRATLVYVWRRSSNQLIAPRIDVPSGLELEGTPAVSLSSDGKLLAVVCEFIARDVDVAKSDVLAQNRRSDIVLCDLEAGTSRILTRNSAGGLAHGSSGFPAISADGRWVAFLSYGSDLGPDTKDCAPWLFVADTRTGRIEQLD